MCVELKNKKSKNHNFAFFSIYIFIFKFRKNVRQTHEKKTKKVFKSPIVTEVKPLEDYYIAEEIHQDYYARNKQTSYCQFIINPKLQRLNKAFAAYYK